MLINGFHVFPFGEAPDWSRTWLTRQTWSNKFWGQLDDYAKELDPSARLWPAAVRISEELAGYPVFAIKDDKLWLIIKNTPEVTMLILSK